MLQLWQHSVPQLGFQYPYLLRGGLAISALHKASLCSTSEMREGYQTQSSTHLDHCLKAGQDHISDPGTDEALPLFLSCTLIAIHTYGWKTLAGAQEPGPIDQFLHCTYLTRGVGAIVQDNFSALEATGFAPMVGDVPTSQLMTGLHDFDEGMTDLTPLVDRLVKDSDEPSSAALVLALEMLSKVLKELEQSETVGMLLRWPAVVPQDFLAMVERKESVALVLLARFALAFAKIGNCWWLHGLDTRLIACIGEILKKRKQLDDRWAMVWWEHFVRSRKAIQDESPSATSIYDRDR